MHLTARVESQQQINSVAHGDAWGVTGALTRKSILTEGQHDTEVTGKLVHEAEHYCLSDIRKKLCRC